MDGKPDDKKYYIPWGLFLAALLGGTTGTSYFHDKLGAEVKFSNGLLESIQIFSGTCDGH